MSRIDYNKNVTNKDNTSLPDKNTDRSYRQGSKFLFIGLVLAIAPLIFMSSSMVYVHGNSNEFLALSLRTTV